MLLVYRFSIEQRRIRPPCYKYSNWYTEKRKPKRGGRGATNALLAEVEGGGVDLNQMTTKHNGFLLILYSHTRKRYSFTYRDITSAPLLK
jgi:hypothetical protein